MTSVPTSWTVKIMSVQYGLLADFRLQVHYFLVNLSNVVVTVVVGYFQIYMATLHTGVYKFFCSILTDVSLTRSCDFSSSFVSQIEFTEFAHHNVHVSPLLITFRLNRYLWAFIFEME